MPENALQPVAQIIQTVRGQRVILDADLAELYGVTTKALNQAMKRNPERFPEDFAFVLTRQELATLRSQIVTAKPEGSGGRRTLPYAFTEHGAIMAANVLNSARAVEMSVLVVRVFIRLREALTLNVDLAKRLDAVERKAAKHDGDIAALVNAIRALMAPPSTPKRKIGFRKDGA